MSGGRKIVLSSPIAGPKGPITEVLIRVPADGLDRPLPGADEGIWNASRFIGLPIDIVMLLEQRDIDAIADAALAEIDAWNTVIALRAAANAHHAFGG